MSQDIAKIDAVMTAAPVIPVLIIEDPEIALPLGRALVAGGLPALEVTLRTPRALDCIRAMASIEGALVGAGTVLDETMLKASVEAGATFLVSPGASPKLLDAADASPVPLLPGIATAGEMMTLMERGYRRVKFFPAEQAGGADYLKALSSPLPQVKVCPTGGISLDKAPKYLTLSNVACVGGSWVAPADAIAARDWARIEALAREAAALKR